MAAAFGVSAAGFTVKPLASILSDLQAAVWASPALGPDLDLSPQTPDGQMLGIIASQAAANWELLQICYNQYNREDVEGAGADNLGDVIGVPREGESYTQVYATVALDPASAPYAADALVANIAGLPALTFSNVAQVTALDITAGTAIVLFQSTVIGPTAAPAVGTLTAITTPVTGWTAITNPAPGYSQLGAAEEPDALYLPRQAAEVTAEGSCNPSATAAAIKLLGAQQTPPVTLNVSVVENVTALQQTVGGIVLPPHTYAVFVYDGGIGWALGTGLSLIAAAVYANKPAGIVPIGSTAVSVQDPVLGPQEVYFSVPTGRPLFVSGTIVPRPNVIFATLLAAVEQALVAAAVAPTLANGTPPTGQLAPGAYVVGGQIEGVIMGVPGVFDVYGPGGPGTPIQFGFAASPSNTAPLPVDAAHVATILQGTVGTHVVLSQGAYP